MHHDVSSASRASPLFPDGSDAAAPLPPTASSGASRTGSDTISGSSAPFVPQQFSSGRESLYRTSAQSPLLPEPHEGEQGPQPFGAAEQTLIMRQFDQQVQALLPPENTQAIYLAIMGDASLDAFPPLKAEAERIKRQAIADLKQKEPLLPATWSPDSVEAKDWTPVSLRSDRTEGREAAPLGILAPSAVNQARGEVLLVNIEELLEGYAKAGRRVGDSLDPGNPKGPTIEEFAKVVAQAIQELQAVLRDIQIMDAGESKQAQQSKMDAIDVKSAKLEKDLKKQKEIEEKRRKGQKVSLGMKIAGPVVAALGTMVGAGLCVFFGAGVPVIVASVAVGTAMMSYSIVDSVKGTTQQAIAALNKFVEEQYPDSELKQKLLKVFIMSAVVAALSVAIVASGGGAAGSVASSTAAETTKAIVKQMALQAIIMAIMSSNALPELFGEVLKKAGVDDKTSDILEIVMIAVTMVVVMGATMAGGQPGGVGTSSAKETAVQSGQATADEIQKAIDKVRDMTMKSLKMLANETGQAAKDIAESFKEMGRGFKSLKDVWEIQMAMKSGALTPAQLQTLEEASRSHVAKILTSLQRLLQLTPEVIYMADGINRGILGLQVVKLLEEVGKLKEAVELLEAIIQMLEKLLTSIQTGTDTRTEFIASLQDAYTQFYNILKQEAATITQNMQSRG